MQKDYIIEGKKKRLVDILRNGKIHISNKFLILELLNDDDFDVVVDRIDDEMGNSCIAITKSPLNMRGSLCGYEHFIIILDNFISCALDVVNNPELVKRVVMNCLKFDSDILLSKKYFFDGNSINYYRNRFCFLISYFFYNNLRILGDDLHDSISAIKLNLDEIDINNDKDVLLLVSFIDELAFINKNDYKVLALFTSVSDDKYKLFIDWYKMLFEKYEKNIDFIYEYRKFRNLTIK